MSYYFEIRKVLTDLKERDETNYLLDFIQHACQQLNSFGEKDMRYDYFEFMHDLITDYSFNFKNFFLRAFVEYEETRSVQDLDTITEEEFKGELDPILFRYSSLKTNLERGIVIEAWSMFEFSVNTIFEHCFTKEERDSRENRYSKKFTRIIKKHIPEIDDETIKATVSELVTQLDSFVPLMNKIYKISKKHRIEYDKKENDFEFLTFYNRLRNGIHNNFIYKGPNIQDYEFKGNIYRFQDGQPIIEHVSSQFDNIELVGELFLVILRFFKSLPITEKIPNPLPTMKQLY